jgi:hypothetical protein
MTEIQGAELIMLVGSIRILIMWFFGAWAIYTVLKDMRII